MQAYLGLYCPHMPKTHFRMARPIWIKSPFSMTITCKYCTSLLKGLDTHKFLQGKMTDFFFAFLYPNPFCKGVNSKRKQFAPIGSQFFPFRVDPFQQGAKPVFTELPPFCGRNIAYLLSSRNECNTVAKM